MQLCIDQANADYKSAAPSSRYKSGRALGEHWEHWSMESAVMYYCFGQLNAVSDLQSET
jgi:hypothetical protein